MNVHEDCEEKRELHTTKTSAFLKWRRKNTPRKISECVKLLQKYKKKKNEIQKQEWIINSTWHYLIIIIIFEDEKKRKSNQHQKIHLVLFLSILHEKIKFTDLYLRISVSRWVSAVNGNLILYFIWISGVRTSKIRVSHSPFI